MTRQDYINIINKLMTEKYNNPHLQAMYERGFLTGILVELMYYDSDIAQKVIKILKKNKKK